jgi:tetrahydromethanopterin S-methyltransferase subunit G
MNRSQDSAYGQFSSLGGGGGGSRPGSRPGSANKANRGGSSALLLSSHTPVVLQTTVAVSNVSIEDYNQVLERLDEVEKRAVDVSAQAAKEYARSARTIAYLEGQCSRLSVLVDHFRMVNSKLVGDVKAARSEGDSKYQFQFYASSLLLFPLP